MRSRPLRLINSYEVTGVPVVGPTRLAYVTHLEAAVAPYTATRLPNCTVTGLWDALRRAELAHPAEPQPQAC